MRLQPIQPGNFLGLSSILTRLEPNKILAGYLFLHRKACKSTVRNIELIRIQSPRFQRMHKMKASTFLYLMTFVCQQAYFPGDLTGRANALRSKMLRSALDQALPYEAQWNASG